MQPMSEKEWREFIMQGTRTGNLATVRADGRPHVMPVWFLLDGNDLVFTTWHDTFKARDIQRDGRVALSVDDKHFPFSFVMIEGRAKLLSPQPAELLRYTTAIARRYVGDERAEAYGKRNAVPGELLVRVCPTKVVATRDVAG